MRPIKTISLHCSDSDRPEHDSIDVIRRWHVEERHWIDIGYHYVITKDGTVHDGRPLTLPSSAVLGFNSNMIAICLTGRNNFNSLQFEAAIKLTQKLIYQFNIKLEFIRGHNYWNKKKTCPNYPVELITNHLEGKHGN